MKQSDVIQFFDRCALDWDSHLERNEAVISRILDLGGIRQGVHVLDVACGTGVLFPDYLARGVGSLTAVDISPRMAAIAARKFPEARVLCGDAQTLDFGRKFDAVMVYNAFPHFPEPEKLIARLGSLLNKGGRLSVAHGMSMEALAEHHSGSAKAVSIDLLPPEKLAEIFAQVCTVDVKIADSSMYMVSGVKKF